MATPKKPNILTIMVDQLSGTLFPDGPVPWLHVPVLRALFGRSARFNAAYCASPLCGPSRASFMTGRLPSRTGVYDNAAELPAATPTYAHHLRAAGYQTTLVGKMHFVGPDQLHGFEERLTTDIYPADFGWTPDYRRPGERIDWWYHNLGSVTGAGTAEITNQLEYDDAVAAAARAKLYDLARGQDARPWAMTVSFTHPHDPYVARKEYWDLYADCPGLEPEDPARPFEDLDPHSKRLMEANDHRNYPVTDEDVRRARRGYFANISYLDALIGGLFEVLDATEQRENTWILFTSDHGDMLGDKGLWFKMSFYEGSARVPLTIAGPGVAPGLVEAPVSLLDIAPTLAAVAGDDVSDQVDGESLLPLMEGEDRTAPVAMEYCAEGSIAPLVALRNGKWKYIRSKADPDQLFDLSTDPFERVNLAEVADHQGTLLTLRAKSEDRWDLDAFDAEIRESQAKRLTVYAALREGTYTAWDHQPGKDAAEQFMRNHKDLNVLEDAQRFPKRTAET